MKFNPKALALVAVTAGALVVGGTAGATAGALITHNQIADEAVHSDTIKDGGVKVRDLSDGVKKYIDAHAGQDGAPGAPGEPGEPGAPGEAAGVSTDWVANPGSEVVDANTVRLTTGNGTDATSVEVENLNKPVQAQETLSFTYRLSAGAAYAAGAPRVFIEVSGDYINTFDGDPNDPGVDNGDGTFTKTITVGKNGRIGQAGVVKDAGVGTITVTNLTIGGDHIDFR